MNILSKFINLIKSNQYHIFLAVCIALISFISFNLGKIASHEKGSIKVTEEANIYQATKKQEISDQENSIKITPKPLDLRVVVSKKSKSKVYHYTWCPGAKQIKEENKIWFGSAQEAESGGYSLAGNCSL